MTSEQEPAAPAETPTAKATPSAPTTQSPGKTFLQEPERTVKLKGKDYLQVADRVYAFRLDYPPSSRFGIMTEIESGSLKDGWVVFKATVLGPNGEIVATGRKTEQKPTNPNDRSSGFPDWFEKAETGAIGRALGNCGYGTLAALDEDPDHPCDAPRQAARPPQPAARPAAPAATPKAPAKPAEPLPPCVVCGKPMDVIGRVKYCESQGLMPSHSAPACSQDPKAATKAEVKK